jgi:hypothetical protein
MGTSMVHRQDWSIVFSGTSAIDSLLWDKLITDHSYDGDHDT